METPRRALIPCGGTHNAYYDPRGPGPPLLEKLSYANTSQVMDTYSHVLPDTQGRTVPVIESTLQ